MVITQFSKIDYRDSFVSILYFQHPVVLEGKAPDDSKLEEFHVTGLASFNSLLQKQETDFVTGNELCAADYTLVNSIATYM